MLVGSFGTAALPALVCMRAGPPQCLCVAAALLQSEQQRLVDHFVEYAEQVRGAELHLLREHDAGSVVKTFLQQVKELQDPYAASDATANLPGQTSNGDAVRDAREKKAGRETVLFRLIEGAVNVSPLGCPLSGEAHRTKNANASSSEDLRSYASGSSTTPERSDAEEELTFSNQLESFLQLAENEIATKELTGWWGDGESSAAAVRLRSRRVIMPGALVPLALDDTLVIEHKVTLRRQPNKNGARANKLANGKQTEMASVAADVAADIERLRDIFHLHAYQGRLRAITSDEIKVCSGP